MYLRFLLRWLNGEKSVRRTWSKETVLRMNLLLLRYNHTSPREIHRKIRDFTHINFWKGSEFHTFLCYVGVVLLKDFLSETEYEHFLTLFCASTICLTEKYKLYLPKARELFIDFIHECSSIYGSHSISSNIHNICHIVDDVERFGELNTISAYQFENALHHIKLNIKQCNNPLVQIARRLSEKKYTADSFNFDSRDLIPKVCEKFKLHGQMYSKVEFKDFILFKKNGDEWFLSQDNDIVFFEYAFILAGKIFLRGSRVKSKTDFFVKPFSSRFINIFISDCEKCIPETFEISSVKAKLFPLPFKNHYVFIPLLHTLQ